MKQVSKKKNLKDRERKRKENKPKALKIKGKS